MLVDPKMLFLNIFSGCQSWNGMEYVKCKNNDPEMSDVCTLPEKQYKDCRNCTLPYSNIDGWRCNDGRCIEFSLRGDGRPDCFDHSDEIVRKLIIDIFWLLKRYLLLMIIPVVFQKNQIFNSLMIQRILTPTFSFFLSF